MATQPSVCFKTAKGKVIGFRPKTTKTGKTVYRFAVDEDGTLCSGKTIIPMSSPKGRTVNKIGNAEFKKALSFKNKALSGQQSYAPIRIMRKLF